MASTFVSSILHFSEAADAVGKAGSRMEPRRFRRMVASRAAYQLLEQVVGTEVVAQLHQSGENLAALSAERVSQAVGHALTHSQSLL